MKVKYHGEEIEIKTELEEGEMELDLKTPEDLENTIEFSKIEVANAEESNE